MRAADPDPVAAPRRELGASVASAERIVREALARHPGRIALACSFGGPSGMALLDLALGIEPALPVYYVDTGLLFPETYALVERVARRYGIVPRAVPPELSLAAQERAFGAELWGRDPDRCCALRKVAPNRAFLAGYDAWFTGIRRAQSSARAAIEPFEDDGGGRLKVSPLFDWSDAEVWAYVNERGVPVNALHAEGYPSIGCVPCTRRPAPGEDGRAGRWAGFAKTECGLHPYRAPR